MVLNTELKSILLSKKYAVDICKLLLKKGGEARFIGGAVRDILANTEIHDIDIATNFIPDLVEEALKENNIPFLTIGKEFGTITAIAQNQKLEITSLRKDIKCDGRKAIVEYTNNWQEDAARRDFTINAMSLDIDGNIYDYFYGLQDLENKIVKFIGEPEQRIKEDFLRILRFFRFSAYFASDVDQAGLSACVKLKDGLKKVSFERFKSEMQKIFLAPKAYEILKLMQEKGVISCEEKNIEGFKNLIQLYDIFLLKLDVLECFAILFFDCKEYTKALKNSAFKEKERKMIELIHQKLTNDFDEESLNFLWQENKHNFRSIILVSLALDGNIKNQEIIQKLKHLLLSEIIPLPIKGEDLIKIGISPGKIMGEILEKAENLWYKHRFQISKDQLIKEIKNIYHE